MKKFFTRKTIGYQEVIAISFDGTREYRLRATMDTGNSGIFPTIGAHIIEQTMGCVKFSVQCLYCASPKEETCTVKGTIRPKVGKEIQERPIVKCAYIKICGRTLKNTHVALADRSFKDTNALMNRGIMTEMNMVVDPSASYIHGDTISL